MKLNLSLTMVSALVATALASDAAGEQRNLRRNSCVRGCRAARRACILTTEECSDAFQVCESDCKVLAQCKRDCKTDYKDCRDECEGEVDTAACIENVCATEKDACVEECTTGMDP